jgi:hypothetical protein
VGSANGEVLEDLLEDVVELRLDFEVDVVEELDFEVAVEEDEEV